MRRFELCVFVAAIAALIAPAMVSADYMIEGESANAFRGAKVGSELGAPCVQLNFPWDQRGSAYYWLDTGSIAPGNYNLTVTLRSDGAPRHASAQLRTGQHLANDGNWLAWDQTNAWALASVGGDVWHPALVSNSDSVPVLFTFLPGTNYTLALNAAGYDMSYANNFTLSLVSEVPEPSAIALVITGVLGLLAYAWRKRR